MTTIHPDAAALRPDGPQLDTPAGRRGPAGSDRDAWRLAFERAGDGFGAWFPAAEPQDRGTAIPHARGHAQGAGAPPSRPAASLFAGSAPAPAATASARGAGAAIDGAGVFAAPPTPSARLAAMLAADWGRPVTALESPGEVQGGPDEPPSVSAAGARAPGLLRAPAARDGQDPGDEATHSAEADRAAEAGLAAEREPVRTHVEQVDGGVRVWLGADAHALPALDAVVAQLQDWFSSQGVRLVGLVCNGRVEATTGRGKVHAFDAPLAPDHADTFSAPFQVPSQTDATP